MIDATTDTTRESNAPIIALEDVHKRYGGGRPVLCGVDLSIDAGEFVAIMGRSGCGKTTLLNVMAGLDADFEGRATVAGRRLDQLGDRALSEFRNEFIGFVFQAFHLLDHLNCRENVSLPALFDPRGGPTYAERTRRADALLERVGLSGVAERYPGELSGGERQRVAIARALFQAPRVLIADEPTGNLDATTGDQILAMFRQLNDDDGITLVVVTHDPVVARSADRVIRVEDGRIVRGDAAA